jgi:electron transport complex protein RnfC
MTNGRTSNQALPLPAWGIRLESRKVAGETGAIKKMPPPGELIVALKQNIGVPAEAIVQPGERVLKGQPIAIAPRWGLSVAVHAPTSGSVTALEERPIPIAGGGTEESVIIEPDGKEERYAGYIAQPSPLRLSPPQIRNDIMEAGIVGLGGALFPTATKLNPGSGIQALILNGVECEPYISVDNALLTERSDQVLLGAVIMLGALDCDECLVAVKADMAEARAAVQKTIDALGDDRISMVVVPAFYPAGGERQLIELITGKEVQAGGLPWDVGVVCQNVGTAAAVAKFFDAGEPLISRIVTVTGNGVAAAANIEVMIGTPIGDVIEFAGGYTDDAAGLVMGGPMMGFSLPHDQLPVTKATNCILVAGQAEIDPPVREMPCIRCGECAQVCPAALMPQQLLALAGGPDYEALETQGLQDCIECGCCDYVCPSYIPLTSRFIKAKQDLWENHLVAQRSELALRRFDARGERLERRKWDRSDELQRQVDEIGPAGNIDAEALRQLKQRVKNKKPGDNT